MKLEKIVVIGAEGGDFTLYGWKSKDGEWRFSCESNEQTLMDMMPKDDRNGLHSCSKSGIASSWEEGVELLSRYPWTRLYPLYVHPEFADRVMQEVLKPNDVFGLENQQLGFWQSVCAGE